MADQNEPTLNSSASTSSASSSSEKDELSLEWSKSPHPRWKGTLVFVPFYGAQRSSLRRHIEWVNELGYHAVIFDLKKESRSLNLSESYFSLQAGFGMKHVWADQIERVLNAVPGPKVIYAFSNPSASAMEAIVRRHGADICGLICDSGPSGEMVQSMINYFKHIENISIPPLRWAVAAAVARLWSPQLSKATHAELAKFPEHVEILSIRGWKDQIITTSQIDKVFEPHPNLRWRKLSLPTAAHVNGLKDFPDDYKPGVENFLQLVTK